MDTALALYYATNGAVEVVFSRASVASETEEIRDQIEEVDVSLTITLEESIEVEI